MATRQAAATTVRSDALTFPYRHIACAVDSDPVSLRGADEAARLRGFAEGRLTFLHASEAFTRFGMPPADGFPIQPPGEDVARQTEQWLEEVVEPRGGHGVLLAGYPPAAVVAWASRNEVDLIVAGAHRGVVDRMLLGGFASYLAGHSKCPVLLVRPGPLHSEPTDVPFRHIAVCIDDSEPSRRALNEAKTLAGLGAAKLSIVHVAQWPMTSVMMGYAYVPDATDTISRAEEWLRDLVAASGEGEAVLLKGDPASSVCAWAHEAAPDLIVAAAYRGVGDRVLLGSFARYVAYHAPCEVLLTRQAGPGS